MQSLSEVSHNSKNAPTGYRVVQKVDSKVATATETMERALAEFFPAHFPDLSHEFEGSCHSGL